MLSTLIITIVIIFASAMLLSKVMALPKNILVLYIVQPLVMSATPVLVLIGGILSAKIAPDPSMATLPLTVMILSLALNSIPAAMLAKKVGRKKATIVGFTINILGALVAMLAAMTANFPLFIVASALIGGSASFVQQLRFAAIESATNTDDVPRILSVLMFSAVFAAFIGPELAVLAENWIPSPHGYAGSFLAIAIVTTVAMIIFSLAFTNHQVKETQESGRARPMLEIIKQPIFIIALMSSAIGYGLMSFLMTATPLSMHNMDGFSLQDTKWVVQSHIAAMFLPSILSGLLVKRFGLKFILFAGTGIYCAVVFIALSGQHLMHYWWALVLLGVGWNFLFLAGTSLLPQSYHAGERHKVQAVNDFLIFFIQALVSLLAGWLLFNSGWKTLVYYCAPFILALLIVSFWYSFISKKTPKASSEA